MGGKELAGGQHFSGALPEYVAKGGGPKKARRALAEPAKLVAVVAGRITGENQLDPDSLTVLTPQVKARFIQPRMGRAAGSVAVDGVLAEIHRAGKSGAKFPADADGD